ncbi:MAG: MFS transporter [Chitinivibrionia bacterium]|nr:MFS transporter [Chitinivibrionia bacterium]
MDVNKAVPANLYTKEFLGLNGIILLASGILAVFFQLHLYLTWLHINPQWFGFIIGADSLAMIIIQPLLSPFLHGGNGKKWMITGILIMVVTLFVYRIATDFASMVAVRLLQGAGFICLLSAVMTLMVGNIPEGKSGEAFSLFAIARLVPYALIPPLMSHFVNNTEDFVGVLSLSGLVLACSLPVAFLLRPAKSSGLMTGSRTGRLTAQELRANLKNRKIVLLFAATLLLYSGYTIIFFFLEGYGKASGIARPGLFFTIVTAAMLGIRLAGTVFFDKMNKVAVSIWSMIGMAAASIMLAHGTSMLLFSVTGFTFGILRGISMPLFAAMAFDLYRGLNVNLSVTMLQGGFFLGPFLGGLVLGRFGYVGLYYFCAVLYVLGAIVVWHLKDKPEELKEGLQR